MTEIKTPLDAPTKKEQLKQNFETIFVALSILALSVIFVKDITIPVVATLLRLIADIWQYLGQAGQGAFLGAIISGIVAGSIFLADLAYRKRQNDLQIQRDEKKAMGLFIAYFHPKYEELVNLVKEADLYVAFETPRDLQEYDSANLGDFMHAILTFDPYFQKTALTYSLNLEAHIRSLKTILRQYRSRDLDRLLICLNYSIEIAESVVDELNREKSARSEWHYYRNLQDFGTIAYESLREIEHQIAMRKEDIASKS